MARAATGWLCALFFLGTAAIAATDVSSNAYGTFGLWAVFRGTDPGSPPLCTMVQKGDREKDPSITLMVMATLPDMISVGPDAATGRSRWAEGW